MTILKSKLVKYFFSAGIAAIVDVSGFAMMRTTHTPIGAAAAISFCLAAVVNYLLSSRYVFLRVASLRGFGLFFVAALGGLVVNVSVTLICNAQYAISPVPAKIVGIGTAFLFNFWLNQRIVFRAR